MKKTKTKVFWVQAIRENWDLCLTTTKKGLEDTRRRFEHTLCLQTFTDLIGEPPSKPFKLTVTWQIDE